MSGQRYGFVSVHSPCALLMAKPHHTVTHCLCQRMNTKRKSIDVSLGSGDEKTVASPGGALTRRGPEDCYVC